jgi:hypothetical protein
MICGALDHASSKEKKRKKEHYSWLVTPTGSKDPFLVPVISTVLDS